MPPSRMLKELNRREGTILTAGPGGRKNPLMTDEERRRIRRRFRRSSGNIRADGSVAARNRPRSLLASPGNTSDSARGENKKDRDKRKEKCNQLWVDIENTKLNIQGYKKSVALNEAEVQKAQQELIRAEQEFIISVFTLGISFDPSVSFKQLIKFIPIGGNAVNIAEKYKAVLVAERNLEDAQGRLNSSQKVLENEERKLSRLQQEFQSHCSGQ